MKYILITKKQLEWYKNSIENQPRYFLERKKNYLYRRHPLTTNRFCFNKIDLRDSGNSLNNWAKRVIAPASISLSMAS